MANQTYDIHAGLWNTTKLPGLTGAAVQVGRQTRIMANSGSPHRRLISAARYVQQVTLQTRALSTMLAKLGTSGTDPVPCSSIAAVGNLVLGAAQQDDILPKYTSGSTHELMTIAAGLACLRDLSWSGPGDGVDCGIGIWPLSSDGGTSGWSIAAGALPSMPTAEEEYDLATAQWNGSDLLGMTNLRVSFDTGPSPIFNPGKIYPQYIRQAPTSAPIAVDASFTLPDRSVLRSYGEHFSGGAIANLVLTFKQFDQAAARNTSKIVTFTIAGVAEVTAASDGRPSSVNVTVHGIAADGVTSPCTWSIGA